MPSTTIDLTPAGSEPGSVIKEILREGDAKAGKPYSGDAVEVHYVGTLLSDGSKFDSSRDRNDHFRFNVGKGEVIKGWDVGVLSMNKGELAKFTLKPDFAYGASGSPPKIPPNSSLVFEVELFDFKGEDITAAKDGGIIRRILESGEGLDHPNEEATVEIAVQATYAGKVFDERTDIRYTLSEAKENGLPEAIDIALLKMKKLETSLLTVSSAYGFGSAGLPAKGVPADAPEPLVYRLKLKSFERSKESWQLDGPQKIDQSKLLKTRGTDFFKAAKYDLAAKKYRKIIEFLEHEISLKGDQETERQEVLQAGRLNLAMCYLKLKDWLEARNICDKVIEENDESEKAFFRRGEALYQLNDHEMAKKDFERVVQIDPENKAAKNKVTICAQAIKKQKEKEKKTFANMFDKFAKIDAKREEELRNSQEPMEINEWKNGKGKATNGNGDADMDTIKVTGDVNMEVNMNDQMG